MIFDKKALEMKWRLMKAKAEFMIRLAKDDIRFKPRWYKWVNGRKSSLRGR